MENVGASYPDQRSVVLLNFGERGRYIEAPGDNPAPSSVANWVAVPVEMLAERAPDRLDKMAQRATNEPVLNATDC